MPKNVVLCCDGTANEFAVDRTNVLKLFFTLVNDEQKQITFYHPGLGTMEPPGALTRYSRAVTKLAGQAIGYGLEADIRDAYVFLMNHFAPDDRLFMFGFSRGAYTARAVAALLHMYGLIRAGNEPLVPYAIRMMMAINAIHERDGGTSTGQSRLSQYFDLATQFKNHFGGANCAPHFVGVWDTVSSVGWIESPVHLPFTSSNPDIAIGRHAIAIDEKRAFFRSNLWHPTAQGGPKDIKQVWFAGVHCDVGGGYPEAESALSKIPLAWMLNEAVAAGVQVDPAKVDVVLGKSNAGYVAPDPQGPKHESLTLPWWPCEFIPKRHWNWEIGREERKMNCFRPRTIPVGSLIHQSVYTRGGYSARLPPNAVAVP